MAGRRAAIGKLGEDAAASYLKRSGYRILERNFRCSHGEIDIVAMERGTLAFVEVRTRSSDRAGSPQESVGEAKQRKLRELAACYLETYAPAIPPCRFDVVAVRVGSSGRVESLELVRDAF